MALEDQYRDLLSDKEDTAKKSFHGQHPQTEGRALADNPKAWLNDYKAALTPGESVEPAPLRGSLVDKAATLALDSEPARVKRVIDAVEGNESVKVAAEPEQDKSLRDINLSKAVGPGTDRSYAYVSSSGDIDSFQNKDTGIHVHIDREGNFYNQARELVNASAALSYAKQQNVIAPANLLQSRENLPPLPADSPAAVQQTVRVPEPVAKIAQEYAPAQALSF